MALGSVTTTRTFIRVRKSRSHPVPEPLSRVGIIELSHDSRHDRLPWPSLTALDCAFSEALGAGKPWSQHGLATRKNQHYRSSMRSVSSLLVLALTSCWLACIVGNGESWASSAELENALQSWRSAITEGRAEGNEQTAELPWKGGKHEWGSRSRTCTVKGLRATVYPQPQGLGSSKTRVLLAKASYDLTCSPYKKGGEKLEVSCRSVEGTAESGTGDLIWVVSEIERCTVVGDDAILTTGPSPSPSPSPRGEAEAQCYNNGTCNGDLECIKGKCLMIGVEGAPCRSPPPIPRVSLGLGPLPPPPSTRPCDTGLVCYSGVCRPPREGTKGGPCYENNTCDTGLECRSNTCTAPRKPSVAKRGERGRPCRTPAVPEFRFGTKGFEVPPPENTCDHGLVCKEGVCQE